MNPRDELETKSIFVGLSREQLEKIIRVMRLRHFEPGDMILTQGSTVKSLNVIRFGKVRIFTTSETGEQITLSEMSGKANLFSQYGGEFFGEMSLFDYEPVSASVVAVEPTELWQISQEDLFRLFREDPELQIIILTNLVRILSRRLRLANATIRSLQPA